MDFAQRRRRRHGQNRITSGKRDGSTVGGHLLRATVYPTLEVFIADLGGRLTRKKDEKTGLMLLAL